MIITGKKTHTWIMNNAINAHSKVSNNLWTHLWMMDFKMNKSGVNSHFKLCFPCKLPSN